MSQKTVNQRVEELVNYFSAGNKSAFAKNIGVSSQGIGEILGGRQSAPSFALLQKLFSSFPQVRMQWLILGEGPMLVTHSNTDAVKGLQEKITYAKQDYKAKYERMQLALLDKQSAENRYNTALHDGDGKVEENFELIYAYELCFKYASDYAAVVTESAQAARMCLASLHLELADLMKRADFAQSDVVESADK